METGGETKGPHQLGGDIGACWTGQTTTVEGGLHIHVTPAEEWTTFMKRLILTNL